MNYNTVRPNCRSGSAICSRLPSRSVRKVVEGSGSGQVARAAGVAGVPHAAMAAESPPPTRTMIHACCRDSAPPFSSLFTKKFLLKKTVRQADAAGGSSSC